MPALLGADRTPSRGETSVTDEFDALQQQLVEQWNKIGRTLAEHQDEQNTVVVIPSVTIDVDFPTYALQAYEERMLFLLFLLRKPGIRVVFVTSRPVPPDIVDYYLELIPGVVGTSARRRLHLVSPQDASAEPLTRKLLDRPHLIHRIRSLVDDPAQAHIIPFNTTDLERELAVRLGLPMYAADPRFFAFGTKSGSRRVFREEGVKHPLGVEDIFDADALVDAIAAMRAERPEMQRVVVKLDEGVSGLGNALVELASVPAPGDPGERAALQEALRSLDAADGYLEKLSGRGGIVEEYLAGSDYRSPSVQLRLTPAGDVELLSTHDQLLGGPDGQSYVGAVFPADPEYCGLIVDDAMKIGQRFAREGILGRFAIDFVVVRTEGGPWESFAIEVNLRKGGTTAPFLILQYLTDGYFDATSGVFRTPAGRAKYYVASDHIESPSYRAFTVDALLEIVSRHRMHFDHSTQTGVVLHLLTGVAELGRVGATVIDDSPALAQQRYDDLVSILDREAAALA